MSAKHHHKHPALAVLVLFIAGILGGDAAGLSPVSLLAASGALLVITFWLLLRHLDNIVPLPLALLVSFAGATDIVMERQGGPTPLLDGPVTVLGTVKSWPVRSGTRTEFELEVDKAIADSTVIATRLKLLAHIERDSTALFPGMIVVARGNIELPAGQRNPGEFDRKSFLSSKGISGIFMVERGSRILTTPSLMGEMIATLRSAMSMAIRRTIGKREGRFLEGLLLGDRTGIRRETRDNFSNAGVSHILAVSGTHVAIIAGFLFFGCQLLRIPRVIRSIILAGGLTVFTALTGGQAPVVRASIMAVLLLLGNLLGERTTVYNTLGCAGLMILGAQPYQVYDPGFQLSFAAVLSIVYGYSRMNPSINRIRGPVLRSVLRLGAVPAAALLGTLPIALPTFERVSFVGLAANIVIVPAAGLGIALGLITLLIFPFSAALAAVYGGLTTLVLRGILFCVDTVGQLPFAAINTASFGPLEWVTLSAGIALLSQLGRPRRVRILTMILLATATIAVYSPMLRRDSVLRFAAVDVGQGDALVVMFPHGEVLVVDAGPSSGTFDSGERIVGPFLRRQGISTIDMLVATHPHADHIGGMSWLLGHFDVRTVLDCGLASPMAGRYRRGAQQCSVMTARSGTIIREFEDARVYILHPDSLWLRMHSGASVNNHSIVLKVVYGSTSLLLMGDAEREAEERITLVYGAFLRSSVLKAGHHGSATSTSENFLRQVRPSTAVVSVGALNSFHHPSPVILRRLRDHGVEVHRTDEEGAVLLESDGTTWSVIDWGCLDSREVVHYNCITLHRDVSRGRVWN